MGRARGRPLGPRDRGAGARAGSCGTCSGSARERQAGQGARAPDAACRRGAAPCDDGAMSERARLPADLPLPPRGARPALDADARGRAVDRRVRALAGAPPRRSWRRCCWSRSGRSAGRATSGRRGRGSGSACPCCWTSPPAGRGASPPGAVRRVACVWALVERGGGDPDADLAAHLAAGRRAATSGRPGRCSGWRPRAAPTR